MKINEFYETTAMLWIFLFFHFNDLQSMYTHNLSKLPGRMKSVKKQSLEVDDQLALQAHLEFQTQQRKKKCYDLIMILDSNYEKYGPNKEEPSSFSCSYNWIQACLGKSFPIIVSSNIVENYCLWKKQLIPLPSVFRDPVVMRTFPTDKDWYCYSHKKAPLLLLIPKSYIIQFAQRQGDMPISQQIKQCGFDVSNLYAFENILPDTLLHYIEKQGLTKIDNYRIRASDVESFFIKPDQFNIPYAPSWNIYLDGHGHLLSIDDGKVASIAGLPEDEFFKLIKMFDKIKTSFLFYASCYSAGQNLIKVQRELAKLTVNFMVSAIGINEAPSCSNTYSVFSQFFSNLEMFFGYPETFFLKVKNAGWAKEPISFLMSHAIDKELLDMLQPWIYIPATGVYNASSVDKSIKILTKSLTKAYEFEEKVIDFTNPNIRTIIVYPRYIGVPVKIKAHVAIVSPTGLMIENEPITFEKIKKEKEEDTDKWTAQESSSKIIHFFEKIIYEDKLSSVLSNFILFQSSYFPITFVIKELVCFDYHNSGLNGGDNHSIVLKNVIISIYRSNLTVLFNYKGSIYSFSQKIEIPLKLPMSDYNEKFFKQFASLPVLRLEPEGLNQLLIKSNLLKHCGLDKNSSDYVSLEMIIQDIESKIDKDFSIQKPGVLKKSLLLKQKSILEESIDNDPKTLKQFWAYAKNLPKRVEQAQQLEQEIGSSFQPFELIFLAKKTKKYSTKKTEEQLQEEEKNIKDISIIKEQLVQQQSSLSLMSKIKSQITILFRASLKWFSNMIGNAQEYIRKKMFPAEK